MSKTLYELIVGNREIIRELMVLGVVPTSIARYLAIYQYYIDALALGEPKSIARCRTLAYFCIGERYFYKVLKKMTTATD